ncbi:MAG: HAD-IC family P-type ATPase, partial [Acidobacteriota bacterium]
MDRALNITESVNSAHSESADSVLLWLAVDPRFGLTEEQAEIRLGALGPNALETQISRSAWRAFAAQFSSIVIWLLAAAALVSALTGSPLEAIAIVIVLILNAVIGFAIEWQSGRALETLRRASRSTARVRRNGREHTIDAANLVRGDIFLLTAGDHVPADSRLIDSVNLRTDESTLTGESVPVEKSAAAVEKSTPLAERTSMVFLGTNVVAGHALAVVTGTGKDTEIGRVGQLLEGTSRQQTPLETRLGDLGKRLVYLVLGICLVVLAAGFIRGDDPWLVTKISISLAVAAVPEGLPAVTTLILALGVLRMAKASAIVRHLAAVETLGSTTVICTDKTGTLTENQMKVRQVFIPNGRLIELPVDEKNDRDDAVVERLLRVAVLCNQATFHPIEKESFGDPTETALLVMAHEFGVDVAEERARNQKISDVPFEAVTKRMIAVFDAGNAEHRALMKGAPSVVLDACQNYSTGATRTDESLDTESRNRFYQINETMAGIGLRVLAFADKTYESSSTGETGTGYTFLGFVGMSDPPRREVPAAIRGAKDAGIRVVMLTGDQLLTAQAIARELHLSEDNDVFALHSRDLIDADSEQLAEFASRAHVFARVTPEDKLRIVRAL